MKKRISSVASIAFALLILIFAVWNLPRLKTPVRMLFTGETDFSGFTQFVHESYVNETVGRYAFVDLNGLFMRVTGRRTDNSVMKLKNGMLTEENSPLGDVTKLADGINTLAKYVREKGTPFLYVQIPYKLDMNEELVIEGKRDHSNENADRLLDALEAEVDTLDLRPLLCKDEESI